MIRRYQWQEQPRLTHVYDLLLLSNGSSASYLGVRYTSSRPSAAAASSYNNYPSPLVSVSLTQVQEYQLQQSVCSNPTPKYSRTVSENTSKNSSGLGMNYR